VYHFCCSIAAPAAFTLLCAAAIVMQLEDLWLNDNQIASLDGLEEALISQRHSLTTIYMENNPAAKAADYKTRMLQLLPNLSQLDSDVLPTPA
jgi:hypothetical protein